jgi:hypothetical protein
VVRQNLETAAAEAIGTRGTSVRAAWRAEQEFEIKGQPGPGSAPSPDE